MSASAERDPERLLKLAEAISDGAPVDWDAEESTHPDLRDTLHSLRALEVVARTHQEAPAPEPAPSVWGTLRIRARIGRGGFGEVYRAYDPALDCEVALKLRKPGSKDGRDFLAEARKLARMGPHPNILRVLGADEHEGRVGIWTELLSGQTLEELLADKGPFGHDEAALVGMSICRALATLHRHGLVHCDVKTMNVMHATGGRIVLMDFGSAEEIQAPSGGEPLVASMGTPLTMAPEQLRGERPGPAADIWGAGALLYRLVTGRYPIAAGSFEELVRQHRRQELVPLCDVRSDLPADFVRVVERALAFEPAQRYASPGELYRALAGVIGVRAPVNDRDLAPPAAWWRRLEFLAAAACVVVVLGIGSYRIAERRFPWEPAPSPQLTQGEAAPSVAAHAPPTVTSLIATARLFREAEDSVQRLLPGAQIAPGDHLFLEIMGSLPMHVYVLNQDERGRAYVLFPGPAFDQKGPLAAGVTHRLPGTRGGKTVDWQVTSSGGRETVIVIASTRPQPELEKDIAALPPASPDEPIAYGEISKGTMEALRGIVRGIGGLTPAPTSGDPGADAVEGIVKKLYVDSVGARDIWTWQIDLENP